MKTILLCILRSNTQRTRFVVKNKKQTSAQRPSHPFVQRMDAVCEMYIRHHNKFHIFMYINVRVHAYIYLYIRINI